MSAWGKMSDATAGGRRALLGAVVLFLAGAAHAAPAPGAAPSAAPRVPRSLDVPDGALVASGKAPELDLLYTGDVVGYVDPCG